MTDVFAHLPQGHFGAIVADPPWNFATFSDKGRDRCPDAKGPMSNDPVRHYATMSLDDIKALPVATLAARDCVLLLWVVDSMLPQALEVGAAWGSPTRRSGSIGRSCGASRPLGATTKTTRTTSFFRWALDTGPGPIQSNACCSPGGNRNARRQAFASWSSRREHSRKPDEILGYVESLVSGPYLELFARTQRPGWHSWGNETDKFNTSPIFEDLIG